MKNYTQAEIYYKLMENNKSWSVITSNIPNINWRFDVALNNIKITYSIEKNWIILSGMNSRIQDYW